jgi:hypothetical protein
MKIFLRRSVLLIALMILSTSLSYSQNGWWLFDNPADLTTAVPGYGPDLVLTGTQTAVAGPTAGNGAVSISIGSYYTLTHGIAPNGGGTKVNQYSLMFDFKVAQALGMWHNFFQTDPVVTANDGEYFIRSTTGALGTLDLGYTTPFVVSDNTWYRLILSVNNGSSFKAYINGNFVFNHNVRPVDDTRYSLASVLHLFGDDDGDDGLIDVAEVAIWDYALSESEILALGTPGTALPVELVSFTAAPSSGDVLLSWETATEVNNSGFSIERKNQSAEWKSVGFIPGYGTSADRHNYSFVDKTNNAGKYTYRLKQIDHNGQYSYSKEVEVVVNPSEFKLYNNYPNPFNPATTISYNLSADAVVSLKIYNSIGELVTELFKGTQAVGYYELQFNSNINGTNLSSGIYFAELKTNENVQRIKMMLNK